MEIFRKFGGRAARPSALTIGNFDGLHLGHRAMLERLTARARGAGLAAAVMTFEPHPRELFAPEHAPPRLTSLREKLALLEGCGIDRVFVCRFDKKLAALPAQDFVEHMLVQGVGVRHLIVGDDFRFGKGRGGDFALLEKMGAVHGYSAEAMHTVTVAGERVSSSAVRHALAAGELEHAARLLGRPYVIAGRVVRGDGLGRKLGFPTANVQLKRLSPPLTGVFAVTVSGLAAEPLPGVANLGVRPTVSRGLTPVLEVHVFDFERDLYGAHVSVNFLHKLRAEQKFPNVDALREQIARDVEDGKAYFFDNAVAALA